MEAIIFLIVGAGAGFAVAWLLLKGQLQKAVAGVEQRVQRERAQTQEAAAEARKQQAVAEAQLRMADEQHARQLAMLREQHVRELDTLREQHVREQQTQREQHTREAEERMLRMQEEMKTMANTLFTKSRELFNRADRERLDALLTPLSERLETFRQAVEANSKEALTGKTELKTTFAEAMKRLHDEQERTIRALQEQTERIGSDAAALTQALKGDSKMQGDWGEMILEKTLETCGLTRDHEFRLQATYRDEAGNLLRPDAVVDFPNGERTVIDAKVSLTDYHRAVNAATPDEREARLHDHVASVRRHIDELAAKNYDRIVPGCIGYVLMFVPYESGYSAALKAEPTLLAYAYKKHIILLSPSNLLMALQLTNTMWQNYRLNKNVDEILRQSNDLYDKLVTFAETFVKLDADFERMHTTYEKAKSQLREGSGNVMRRLERIRALGLSPKKQMPDQLA